MITLNKSISSVSIIALTLALTAPAFAFDITEVENTNKPFASEFSALTPDSKGEVSWATIKKDTNISHKNFVAYDKDKSGTLNYKEFAELKTDKSRKEVGRIASDSWVTTKAKTELLAEKNLESLKISVETHNGKVLLSGFVDSLDQKEKAEAVVKNVEGVKSIQNSLIVKKENG